MSRRREIFALLTCLFATACAKPAFTVQPLQASNVIMTSNSNDPSVPKQMQFTVTACLTNSASSGHYSVSSNAFTLDIDGTTKSLQSDEKGCLYWQENINFNWLDAEHYVKFSRSITGQGNFSGTQNVQFAMDPWKTTASGFVDSRVTPIDDSATNVKAESMLTKPNPVFVRTVSIHTYDPETTQDGTTLHADLILNPFLTRTGLSSVEVLDPITEGHFHIELFLLELNKNGIGSDTHLLAHENSDVDAKAGVIALLSQLHLNRTPKQDSQLALAFRLTYQAQTSITQESMVLMDQLITQSTLTIQPMSQTVDSIPVPSALKPSISSTDLNSGAPGFRVDSVEVVSGGVTSVFPSTQLPKSVAARVTVCLKDALSLRSIVDHEFQIGISDPKQNSAPDLSKIQSNSSGCLFWQTELDFDGYAQEQWYERQITIHSNSAPYVNVQQSVKVSLNPSQSGSLYFWDSRNGAPPSEAASLSGNANALAQSPQASTEASLLVKEISYAFTGRDFNFDESSNLTMNRHYQIRFSPVVAFKKPYTSETDNRPINDGRLSVKVLVMSGDSPLSFYSGTAVVANGQVVTDITLPFSVLRFPAVINRNQLLIEISDTDPKSTLKSDTFSTPFIAINATGSSGLQENAQSIDTITSRLSTFNMGTAMNNGTNFAVAQKLIEGDLLRIGFTSATEIQNFVNSNASTGFQAARFCEVVYSEVQDIAYCQQNPAANLKFASKNAPSGSFGVSIEQAPDVYMLNASSNAAWRMDQAVSANKGYSSTSTVGVSTKANVTGSLGLGANVFGNGPNASASLGADASMGHTWAWYSGRVATQSQSQSHDFAISKIHSLVVDQINLETAVDPGKCLSVSKPNDAGDNSPYFCASPHDGKKVTNTWYFVHPQYSSATLVDSNELDSMSFTAVIQGSDEFDKFKQLVQDKNDTIVFDKNMTPPENLHQTILRKIHWESIKGEIQQVLPTPFPFM